MSQYLASIDLKEYTSEELHFVFENSFHRAEFDVDHESDEYKEIQHFLFDIFSELNPQVLGGGQTHECPPLDLYIEHDEDDDLPF